MGKESGGKQDAGESHPGILSQAPEPKKTSGLTRVRQSGTYKQGPGGREMSGRLVIESREHHQELSGIGATEQQVDLRDTVPQRIDKVGTKIEDLAGTGEQDSPGG